MQEETDSILDGMGYIVMGLIGFVICVPTLLVVLRLVGVI